jgi:tetratricopeptide (TPR) repeat protein
LFLLAQAHCQLGEKQQAHKCYEKAVRWMGRNHGWPLSVTQLSQFEELPRFRREAAQMLGIEGAKLAYQQKEEPPGDFEIMLWSALAEHEFSAGAWKKALVTLNKVRKRLNTLPLRGSDEKWAECSGLFYLARVHWQLGEKEKAREWYDQGVRWMAINHSWVDDNEQRQRGFQRYRAEAEKLLGIKPQNN